MSDDVRRKQREFVRRWNADWKAKAHAALGGVCARCGFSDARALQIDHVDGDGNAELKTGRRRKGSLGSYYKRVVAEAENGKYQLLCANCNWIKRHENGEHTVRIA